MQPNIYFQIKTTDPFLVECDEKHLHFFLLQLGITILFNIAKTQLTPSSRKKYENTLHSPKYASLIFLMLKFKPRDQTQYKTIFKFNGSWGQFIKSSSAV